MMWLTIVFGAYLVLSLVAALIFYCAVAITDRTTERSQKRDEESVSDRFSKYSVFS